jgi:hypothetical protein
VVACFADGFYFFASFEHLFELQAIKRASLCAKRPALWLGTMQSDDTNVAHVAIDSESGGCARRTSLKPWIPDQTNSSVIFFAGL